MSSSEAEPSEEPAAVSRSDSRMAGGRARLPPLPADWGAVFAEYDPAAENAVTFLPMNSGRLVALMNARQTHKMGCFLLQRSQRLEEVVILAYSWDEPNVMSEVRTAHERGVKVELIADHRMTFGATTRAQTELVKELVEADMIVRTCSGENISAEYARAGRSVFPATGILHAKVMYAPPYLMVGSANWTTSSRCNQEVGVLLYLEPAGQTAVEGRMDLIRGSSTRVTEDALRTHMEAREEKLRLQGRSSASSGSRSRSTPRGGIRSQSRPRADSDPD